MRFLLLIILTSLFVPITYAQSYQIKGNVKNLKLDSLKLVKFKGLNMEVARIKVAKGKFEYNDSIAEPFYIQIFKIKKEYPITTNEEKLIEFMVEPGELKITGDATSFESLKVSGSKSDDILKKYSREDQKLSSSWDSLKLLYDESLVRKDIINQRKIGEKLNDILLNKRIPLLKKYVKENAKTTIGALLPNFCSLDDALKKQDYTEMYEMLAPEIRKTGYGQSIQAKSQ